MSSPALPGLVAESQILNRMYTLRDQKIMLDSDRTEMYGVETKQLKRQVKRNAERFPEDFMFTLTRREFEHLMSQNGTSSWGGTRYMPMAFTEQAVAMQGGPVQRRTNILSFLRVKYRKNPYIAYPLKSISLTPKIFTKCATALKYTRAATLNVSARCWA